MTKVKTLIHLLTTNLSGLTAAELMAGAGYPTMATLCDGIRSARRRVAKKGHAIIRLPLPREPGQVGRVPGKYVLRKTRHFENDTVKELTPREQVNAAFDHFKSLVAQKVEGATEFNWYRACGALEGKNTRRNADTSHDFVLATDVQIRDAYNDYITKLHAFYRARDGKHGVLGSRGLQ